MEADGLDEAIEAIEPLIESDVSLKQQVGYSTLATPHLEPPDNFRGVCDFYQTEIGASALVISPSIPEIRAGDPQTLISIAPSLTVVVGEPREPGGFNSINLYKSTDLMMFPSGSSII